MGGVFAAAWFIGVLLYGIAQIVAAWVGYHYLFGPVLGAAIIAGCLWFRFSLPITIGSFVGAAYVYHWAWYWALLFAAPGLAFMMVSGVFAGAGALINRRSRRSTW